MNNVVLYYYVAIVSSIYKSMKVKLDVNYEEKKKTNKACILALHRLMFFYDWL